ncbi:F-box protein SKIP23-like [Coffea arabica]|uniref:F-box protein SKIP23-like n=1 Tax=Coffea arabica TaxID=13443 RepID=A0A6P6TWU0_COFAR|nr:F-box protein SKIP23-like [Coffea arabica]
MGDWSQLLPDLLAVISRHLSLIEDFVAFRGVCTSWRMAAPKQNFVNLWPTVPLLMLAEKKDSDDREFYSLSRGKVWNKLSLPETKNKKCMESRGWLITVGSGGEMNMLHPLSGVQIELPHQSTFPMYDNLNIPSCFVYVKRAALSVPPSASDGFSGFVLMVVCHGGGALGFWRPGDKCWTRVEMQRPWGAFSDVNYYNGKFYAITYSGRIIVCDVSGPGSMEAQLLFSIDIELLLYRVSYLVELAGELLIVARDGAFVDEDLNYGASNFRVFRLDLINCRWKEVTSLGNSSIFVGYNAAFSVESAGFPGIIKPNCIYFTDDCIDSYYDVEPGGGKDMGIYDVEDGKIERFDDIRSFSLMGPPVWVAPSS